MSRKLAALRSWQSLSEAAREVSATTGEATRESDLLKLALDGKLGLAVNVPLGTVAMFFRSATDKKPTINRPIEGVWDFPLEGSARRLVECLLRHGIGGSMTGCPGAFVERDGERCQLPVQVEHDWVINRAAWPVPRGSEIVVRREALDSLLSRLHQHSKDRRPVEARERTTLLVIIAALARKAGLDVFKSWRASQDIEALTSELGARISARTVSDYLKRIPDALERRGKDGGED
jgi:hypothetical protein